MNTETLLMILIPLVIGFFVFLFLKQRIDNVNENLSEDISNLYDRDKTKKSDIEELREDLKNIKENQKQFLTKKKFAEFQEIQEEMQELIKDFKSLNKKKSKVVDGEIKLFQEGIKKSKSELAEMNKEVSEQTKSFIEGQKKSQEQLIKNLNSEYLKKLKLPIKAEDIDTLKVLQDFQERIREPVTDKQKDEILADIKTKIPKQTTLSSKIRLKILQERDTGKYDKKTKLNDFTGLRKVLRNIIDTLLSGIELEDMKIEKPKQEQLQQETKEDEGDYV